MVALFNYRASRNELVARFGAPHIVDEDGHGVASFDAWLLRFECGLDIALWQFHSNVVEGDAPRLVELHANDCELLHLAFHVGIDARAIERWSPDPTYLGDAKYRVVRHDPNGGRWGVGAYTSRCEAEHVATVFAARARGEYHVEVAVPRVIRMQLSPR